MVWAGDIIPLVEFFMDTYKPGMVADTSNSNTQEVGTEGSEVQSHLQNIGSLKPAHMSQK